MLANLPFEKFHNKRKFLKCENYSEQNKMVLKNPQSKTSLSQAINAAKALKIK